MRKNKNDIRYIDFLKLWDYLEKDPDNIEGFNNEIVKIFFEGTSSPSEKELKELQIALETASPDLIHEGKVKINGSTYLVDFDFDNFTWGKFIECENHLKELDVMGFLQLMITKKQTWFDKLKSFAGFPTKGIKPEEISTALYEEICRKYKSASVELKALHPWTFDPPPMPVKLKEETQGDIYRKQFSEHYGGYVEMTYLVSNGDTLKWDLISKLPATEVLFKGEYLLRKNRVENIK